MSLPVQDTYTVGVDFGALSGRAVMKTLRRPRDEAGARSGRAAHAAQVPM